MKLRKIFGKYFLPPVDENDLPKLDPKTVAVSRVITPFSIECSDFMLLSKCAVSSKIKDLLESGVSVICNLEDRDGKFGLKVTDVDINYELETVSVIMTGDYKHPLHDKFLYNLIYNTRKKQYSLETHDEYFEKIEVDEN
jgi:hypothetical protein